MIKFIGNVRNNKEMPQRKNEPQQEYCVELGKKEANNTRLKRIESGCASRVFFFTIILNS